MDKHQEESDGVNQDEISSLESSRLREQRTAMLLSVLRHETEMLAKVKVKAEVLRCRLQSDLQDTQERQSVLHAPLINLADKKEKLQEKIKFKNIYRNQLEKEVLNTETMKNMLLEQCTDIKSGYEENLKTLLNREKEHIELCQSYNLQKLNIQKTIDNKKAMLIKLQNHNQCEILQHETNINKKKKDLQKLTEEYENLKIKCNAVEQQHHDLQADYNKNLLLFTSLSDDKLSMQNSVSNVKYNINELVTTQNANKEQYAKLFNNMEADLNFYNETLTELEKQEVNLQECYTKESSETEDIEKLLSTLEDEHSLLTLHEEQLKQENKNCSEKANGNRTRLCKELQDLHHDYNELTEHTNAVILKKDDKLKEKKHLEHVNLDADEKYKELCALKTKLEQDIATDAPKLENLTLHNKRIKTEIDVLKLSLTDCIQKRKHCDETNDKIRADLDQKMSIAQTQYEEVAQKYEITDKNLEKELDDYKYEQQKVYEQNLENNENALAQHRMEVEKLKSILQENTNNLTHTDEMIKNKIMLRDKYLQDLKKLKKTDLSFKNLRNPGVIKRPASILKSPGKSGISPKKVTFDAKVPESTGNKSDIIDQQNQQTDENLWGALVSNRI